MMDGIQWGRPQGTNMNKSFRGGICDPQTQSAYLPSDPVKSFLRILGKESIQPF